MTDTPEEACNEFGYTAEEHAAISPCFLSKGACPPLNNGKPRKLPRSVTSSTNHHHQMDSSSQHPIVFYNDNPPPTPPTWHRHDENVYAKDYVTTYADMSTIPPLDAGNINELLSCFNDGKYTPLLKFQTVAAALFPLWAEIDLPENTQDFPHKVSAAHHALLTLCKVIQPFPQATPPHVSPVPLLVEIPPTPLNTVSPAWLQAVVSSTDTPPRGPTAMVVDLPSGPEWTPTPCPI